MNTRVMFLRSLVRRSHDPKSDTTVLWQDSYEAFTEDEKSALKAAIEAHIRSEIDHGLRTMNLAPG